MNQDLKYALRGLRKNPGYMIAAVLTLALGIGANTAIFSLINGVLLKPLPYRDGEDLVVLRQEAPKAGATNVPFSIQEFYDTRDQNRTLDLVEYHPMSFTLLGRGEPQRASTGVVSSDFFDVLGVVPHLGRTFIAEDEEHGAEAVLVLSYGYWQRVFGSDEGILDQVFEMNDRPHRVVGVLPPIPQFPNEHDVYMPTSACPFRANGEQMRHENRRAFSSLTVFGRLKPGAEIASVGADIGAVGTHFKQDHPQTYPDTLGYRMTAKPLQEELTRQARPMLWILLGTTALVLLIACTNVANLALARISRRERELAVRAALGAGRGRLARQSLVESLVLAVLGGGLGLLVARSGLDLLASFTARFTPRAQGIEIDGWVLLFTFLVSIVTGLVFGALPAFTSRVDLASALRDGGRNTEGGGRLKLRGVLITAQVAISVMLLVGAGLMLRSLYHLQRVDPGFDGENVLTARVTLNWTKYPDAASRLTFFRSLLGRLENHPGVVSVAAGSLSPLAQQGRWTQSLAIENRPVEDGQLQPQIDYRIASAGYFRTLGIPLVRGRVFTSADHEEALLVAVINQSMAQRFWPDDDALGRRVSLDNGSSWLEVVGIVGDVQQHSLDMAASEELYQPMAQAGWAQNILVRSQSTPMAMADELKAAVWAVDSDQPIESIEALAQSRSRSIETPRLTASLLSLFAALALVITATGIGSVIAFSVGQRTQEIGVRMALGAGAGRVLLMVLKQGLTLVIIGLVIGLIGTLFFGRVISELLFQIGPRDPLTMILVAAVLLAAAALACFLPAHRATRVDPSIALRSD